LSGDHLATNDRGGLALWHDGPSGWTLLYDNPDESITGGLTSARLDPPYLRYNSWDWPNVDPAAVVRRFDVASETWDVASSHTYGFPLDSTWPYVSFNRQGDLFVMGSGCTVQQLQPDGDAYAPLGPIPAFEGRACDLIGTGNTDSWALGTTWGTDAFIVSLVHTGSPEPFVWDTLVGAGIAPFINGWGFLDDRHFVTVDYDSITGPGDVGQLVVWEMTGPPVLQWLATPTPDEGASLPLDPSVYVMDPDHALVDVPLTLIAAPTNGTLSLDGTPVPQGSSVTAQAWMDGRVTYDHDGSETVSDALVLQGCDPDGACSDALLVDVTITPVNDLPTPTDDTLTVPEGGEGLVDVLANDTDVDSVLDLLGVSVAPPTVGTAAVQTDGVRYVHDGSEPGPDPVRLDVTVCDPEGGCSLSTLAVTVTPVNDPPVATDDAATVDEGGLVSVDVLANDTDPDDALGTDGTLVVVSGPIHGTATVVGAALEVQHDGAEASSDTLVYEVCDAAGACAQATLQLAVMPVNDPPLIVGDALAVDEGGTATLWPLGNDTDVDGTVDSGSLAVGTAPEHGAVTVAGDVLTYVHDGTETTADTFTYVACDDGGACGEAAVEVDITPVEHAPVASPDAYAVEGELVVGAADGVLANDTDADSALTAQLVSGPASGTLALAADGGFTYVPDDGFTGTDGFVYAATDGTTAAEAEVVLAVSGAAVDLTATGGSVDGGGGCGCTSGGMAGWVVWAPLLMGLRRRVRR